MVLVLEELWPGAGGLAFGSAAAVGVGFPALGAGPAVAATGALALWLLLPPGNVCDAVSAFVGVMEQWNICLMTKSCDPPN